MHLGILALCVCIASCSLELEASAAVEPVTGEPICPNSYELDRSKYLFSACSRDLKDLEAEKIETIERNKKRLDNFQTKLDTCENTQDTVNQTLDTLKGNLETVNKNLVTVKENLDTAYNSLDTVKRKLEFVGKCIKMHGLMSTDDVTCFVGCNRLKRPSQTATFRDAVQACKRNGGKLALPRSDEDDQVMRDLVPKVIMNSDKEYVWAGLRYDLGNYDLPNGRRTHVWMGLDDKYGGYGLDGADIVEFPNWKANTPQDNKPKVLMRYGLYYFTSRLYYPTTQIRIGDTKWPEQLFPFMCTFTTL